MRTSPDHPPYSPANWDQLLGTTDQVPSLTQHLEGAPPAVRARRMVRIAMTSRDEATINKALDEMDQAAGDGAVSTVGTRLLANITLQQFTSILRMREREIHSLDPYEIEDAADGAFARGMALSEVRRYHEAMAQLLLARKLAQALGMTYRVQHVEMEIGRLHTNMGNPNPQWILDAMAAAPMNARRRIWAGELLAEAHIALGDYQAASTLLAGHNGGQDQGLPTFAKVLLGDEDIMSSETLDVNGRYGPVAQALWALRKGERFSAPPRKGSSPQSEYGSLVRAWGMLQARPMAAQARNMLLDIKDHVQTADQRAHWAAAMIRANLMTDFEDDIDDLVRSFNSALNAMVTRGAFLALLRAISPEVYVLLGLLPDIHSEVAESLPEVPLLTGGEISYRYQQHRLPGRAQGSATIVLAAATGKTGPEARPHPQALQRIREVMGEIGTREYVNLGVMLRVLWRFQSQARYNRRDAWRNAVDGALAWVDSPALLHELRNCDIL